jgi:hypothetical protein
MIALVRYKLSPRYRVIADPDSHRMQNGQSPATFQKPQKRFIESALKVPSVLTPQFPAIYWYRKWIQDAVLDDLPR